MTTRTTAEVEAGAKALYESKPEHRRMDYRSHVWTWGDVVTKMPDIADDYRRRVSAVLDAADATAAPAVGVTVEWLDGQIAETQQNIDGIRANRAGAIELFGASERIRALKEVRALLNTHPEDKP